MLLSGQKLVPVSESEAYKTANKLLKWKCECKEQFWEEFLEDPGMAGEVGAFSPENQLLERFPSVLRFGNTEQLSFLN